MAESTISAGNKTTRFQKKVNREYVRGGKFGAFIGTSQEAVIQTNTNLKKISIPLVGKLSGQGVEGSSALSGNEEVLSNHDFVMTPTHFRNGVKINDEENEKAEFDLFSEARPALTNWAMELKRDQIIQALGATPAGTTYLAYGDATDAQHNTFNTNNVDRILYGSAIGNITAGDHSVSLATIDTTADKLDVGIVELLKRMAQNANPLIRPIMVKNDEPNYVFFVDSYGFRDLRNDTAMLAANREARAKNLDNPIFQGGDLMYDGIVIKEIPDFTKFIDGDGSGSKFDGVWGANATANSLKTGGDSSSRVGMGMFCGAQAVGFLRGKNARFDRDKNDDYGFLKGVGVTMKHELKKMYFNNKQHGMITSFYSAALDS